MLLELRDLILEACNLLLQYLRCFCLSKHTDLSIEVDILESFALHIHILLSMHQISPHPLIVSILSAKRCLVFFQLLGVAHIPQLLVIDSFSLRANLRYTRVPHQQAIAVLEPCEKLVCVALRTDHNRTVV